jgi:hypothetical protein
LRMHATLLTRLLWLVICVAITACSQNAKVQIFNSTDCADELVRTGKSSDQKFVATLIRRDCGATTAPSNIVFLKNSTDISGKDGSWGEAVYVSRGDASILLTWSGAALRIEAPSSGSDVFLSKNQWGVVPIVYGRVSPY